MLSIRRTRLAPRPLGILLTLAAGKRRLPLVGARRLLQLLLQSFVLLTQPLALLLRSLQLLLQPFLAVPQPFVFFPSRSFSSPVLRRCFCREAILSFNSSRSETGSKALGQAIGGSRRLT